VRAVVVYESVFGNTTLVAEAVGAGLAAVVGAGNVDVVEVGPAVAVDDVDLLVVGAPTHAFGLSRPSTRLSAAKRTPGSDRAPADVGMREWLAALPAVDGPAAAAFATRVRRPPLPGSAARAAARRLRRLGYRQVAQPRDFDVAGTEGPLRDGEIDWARRWGRDLARRAVDVGSEAAL
jgi:hypothetical protein